MTTLVAPNSPNFWPHRFYGLGDHTAEQAVGSLDRLGPCEGGTREESAPRLRVVGRVSVLQGQSTKPVNRWHWSGFLKIFLGKEALTSKDVEITFQKAKSAQRGPVCYLLARNPSPQWLFLPLFLDYSSAPQLPEVAPHLCKWKWEIPYRCICPRRQKPHASHFCNIFLVLIYF